MNLRRGLFRIWLAVAVLWIIGTGLIEYTLWPYVPQVSRTEGPCWERLAKWPDGAAFTVWDAFTDEFDIQTNIDINRQRHAWSADSIGKRNEWRHSVRQKLVDCEGPTPIGQRITSAMTDYGSFVINALALIFLPPIGLLIIGLVFGWIAKGFRAAS